jgi:hypothetical protein
MAARSSTITLRSDDGEIPNGSVIEGGYADVITILASGGAGDRRAPGRGRE